MSHMKTLLLATASLLVASGVAAAETNLQKLGQFQVTHSKKGFTYVPQGGDRADAIKQTLSKIKLPPGFKISLYAIVPDARHMAVDPQGFVVFVGTRKKEVWAITDRDHNNMADEVKDFAPTIDKTIPNGPCFSKDGMLYIAEQNRVLQYPAAAFFYESPDVVAVPIVPQGQLIPPADESYNHTARVCRVGPDNKLYITLGQPFNVPPANKLDEFHKWGMGGIIRMNQDGSDRETYTYGVRNSVGLDFNPANGELWFTDNQVDGMGDDQPPGELNRQTAMGQNFGFPWYGGGHTRTNEYKDQEPPKDVVFPAVEMVAHAADLGMTFYTGKMFPAKYRGGIFNAEHGSWNRTVPIGARIMYTSVNPDGSVGETSVFADGWNDNGTYLGRPVDVMQMRDGSLLVSDDLTGAVYRISYGE